MMDDEALYGADCADLLARWDRGDLIHTIEMGGLGPGYEQAIQMTMVEQLRWLVQEKPDASLWQAEDSTWERDRKALEAAVYPKVSGLGLSGAQWGAALSLASRFYMIGPVAVNADTAVRDRHIMCRKNFPGMAAYLRGDPE